MFFRFNGAPLRQRVFRGSVCGVGRLGGAGGLFAGGEVGLRGLGGMDGKLLVERVLCRGAWLVVSLRQIVQGSWIQVFW